MSESIWNDPRITAYVLDELPVDERAEFEQEMNSSEELTAAVAEARGVTSQLGELYLDETTPPLDTQRREAIFAVESNDVVSAVTTETSWRLPLAIMATAATLLMLLGLAPWMAQRKSEIAMQRAHESSSSVESTLQEGSKEEGSVAIIGKDQFDNYRQNANEGEDAGVAMTEEAIAHAVPGQSEPTERSMFAFGNKASDKPAPTNRSRSETRIGQISTEADTEADDSGVFGDVQLEAGQELGTIVIGGEKEEMKRATDVIKQIETNDQVAADSPVDAAGKTTEQIAVPARDENIADTRGKQTRAIEMLSVAGDVMVRDEFAEMQVKESRKVESSRLDVAKSSPAAAPAPAPAPFGGPANDLGSEAVPGEAKYSLEGQASGAEVVPRAGSAVVRLSGRELQEGVVRLGKLAQGVDDDDAEPEGTGPGKPGDQFEPITDNPFRRVSEHPLSTFSVDVDTASYSKTRDFLMRASQLPRPDAVRIEELINYFDYDYAGPDSDASGSDADHPFIARAIVTGCPWNEKHRLARIAIKGKEMNAKDRPKCNLVFLIDTSGSMNAQNKLPLVLRGMEMLVDRLNKKDRVSIVVYAGSAGLVLDSTKVGKTGSEIKNALTRLSAGGSTNGGAGIALAYQTARDNFIKDGVNRVILCTDGDFNVGLTGTDALVRMVEKEAKGGVFLSVLGFGMGNHNDAMLEQVSGRGNGNYAFIDTENEARKVLVEQTNATLVTIAKDVKLQIEFNPSKVSSYRLIGYENRILAKEDFNDDKKDAGEIGAGHEVTALYEIVPAGVQADEIAPQVDPLKYQKELKPTEAADSDEMVTVKLRYKQPDGDKSTLVEFPVRDDGESFDEADADARFAAAVAGFGMQLRRSDYRGSWSLKDVLRVAEGATGKDEFGLRAEFLTMVRKANELMGQH